ncbi:hypothetical protein HPP92_025167 [Vanilla planifolia]|uniref:Uncharacterized protein n=1 Tax=Vanilla planifolia TaxID=51239 RepID=A0A835PH17_VANPL|nr:hypothetical protein HPP92_025167 [Vanilla planifolia]
MEEVLRHNSSNGTEGEGHGEDEEDNEKRMRWTRISNKQSTPFAIYCRFSCWRRPGKDLKRSKRGIRQLLKSSQRQTRVVEP